MRVLFDSAPIVRRTQSLEAHRATCKSGPCGRARRLPHRNHGQVRPQLTSARVRLSETRYRWPLQGPSFGLKSRRKSFGFCCAQLLLLTSGPNREFAVAVNCSRKFEIVLKMALDSDRNGLLRKIWRALCLCVTGIHEVLVSRALERTLHTSHVVFTAPFRPAVGMVGKMDHNG